MLLRYYKSNRVKISISKTEMNVTLYVSAITRRHLFRININLIINVFISQSLLKRYYIITTYIIIDFTITL